jgi:hypothetical protein
MGDFVSQSDFDFSVRVSTHTMTVKAGQPISIPVMVGTIKGEPRPITLSTSDWRSAGVSAEIVPSTVPSGRGAALNISVPQGTAPGSYLFTVRGSTEGTFKTSNDTITVIVEPETEEKDAEDRKDVQQSGGGQEPLGEPAVSASSAGAKRAALFRSAKKGPAGPPSAGQRAVLFAVMFVMIGFLAYYIGTQLRDGSGGSVGTGTGTMAGTYVGTSTFCIKSVMGNAPECSTSTDPRIQIDSSGNVLGPGLFGKINGTSFSGEARAGDGSTFPMTGTFSSGTLTAKHESSSVTWTITVHK